MIWQEEYYLSRDDNNIFSTYNSSLIYFDKQNEARKRKKFL